MCSCGSYVSLHKEFTGGYVAPELTYTERFIVENWGNNPLEVEKAVKECVADSRAFMADVSARKLSPFAIPYELAVWAGAN